MPKRVGVERELEHHHRLEDEARGCVAQAVADLLDHRQPLPRVARPLRVGHARPPRVTASRCASAAAGVRRTRRLGPERVRAGRARLALAPAEQPPHLGRQLGGGSEGLAALWPARSGAARGS